MQVAMDLRYSEDIEEAVRRGKGICKPTPLIRQAAMFIAKYARVKIFFPSELIAKTQDKYLRLGVVVHDEDPDSRDPNGKSVYPKQK